MKTFTSILAVLATPVLFATAFAAEKPGVLADYIRHDGELSTGYAVRVALDDSIAEKNQAIVKKFNTLSDERRAELAKGLDMLSAMEYSKELFDSKAEYDSYLEAWKKSRIVPSAAVGLGLLPAGEPGIWKVHSVTVDNSGNQLPLTISALRYDASKNVWISNNGELIASPYEIGDRCVLGAQTGTEWVLKKEDSFSKLTESIRVTKTTDGGDVYVLYSFAEVSVLSGATIAQGGYLLRFPFVTKKAGLSKPGRK